MFTMEEVAPGEDEQENKHDYAMRSRKFSLEEMKTMERIYISIYIYIDR